MNSADLALRAPTVSHTLRDRIDKVNPQLGFCFGFDARRADGWTAPDYDDSAWPPLAGPGVKGPPEEPFVWVEPDPFLGMQSLALGLRPFVDWPPQGVTVVYRKTIVVP